MEENSPLVSILVVSYNSSNFILDTLESIKNQLYNNIELIISDDCSTDETVSICRDWVNKYANRFKRAIIITHPVNTGIPANFNRAIKEAKGEWIKGIAADDLLLPNNIETYISYVAKHNNCSILGANIYRFFNNNKLDLIKEGNKEIEIRKFFSLLPTASDQWMFILEKYCIMTPTLFVSQKVYKKVLYDESFKRIEDYPFMLNALMRGFRYTHINKETVLYRVSNSSVCHNDLDKKIFNDFYKVHYEFDQYYRIPNFSFFRKCSYYYYYYLNKIFDNRFLNRRVGFPFFLYRLLYRMNFFNLFLK